MLKLVLPKGSLEKATLELFADADLAVHRSSSVTYSATIDACRATSPMAASACPDTLAK